MPTPTSASLAPGARLHRARKPFLPILCLAPLLLVALALWLRPREQAPGKESRSTEALREALASATEADIFDPRETRPNSNSIELGEQAILRGPAVQRLALCLRGADGEATGSEPSNFYVCSFRRGHTEIGFAVVSRDLERRDWLHLTVKGETRNFQLQPGAVEDVARLFKRGRGQVSREI